MKKYFCLISSILLLLPFIVCSIIPASFPNEASSSFEVAETSTEKETIKSSTPIASLHDAASSSFEVEEPSAEKETIKPSTTEAKALIVNLAKEKYLHSDWNGEPITILGNEVSLSLSSGYLAINDSYAEVLNWDLPVNFEPINPQFTPSTYCGKGSLASIPGKGTYLLEGKTLVKYFKGRKVDLKGGTLNWMGLDVNHPEEFDCTIDEYMLYVPYPTEIFDGYVHLLYYQPYLYYYERAGELLLITSDPISHLEYLYRFPDTESSEMQLVSVNLTHSIWGASYSIDTLYYLDSNFITWVWTEDGPKVDLESHHFSDDISYFLTRNEHCQ